MWDGGWHGGGWGWGIVMVLMMIAFWGGLIWLVVALARHGVGDRRPEHGQRPTAEQILHERLARGEIDVDEYRQRLDALRSHGSP